MLTKWKMELNQLIIECRLVNMTLACTQTHTHTDTHRQTHYSCNYCPCCWLVSHLVPFFQSPADTGVMNWNQQGGERANLSVPQRMLMATQTLVANM